MNKRQKIDADPKAIQQIELVGQLKNDDGDNADVRNLCLLKQFFEKIREPRLTFSPESVIIYERWQIMKKQELN